ncbi:MAG: alginate export family protein [Usitatibacter sp.]
MGPVGRYLIVAPLAALSVHCAQADDDNRNNSLTFGDSLARGRLILEIRPRYNYIEETDHPLTTEGGTVRAVAGWRTAPWEGLRLTVEGIHADHLGAKRFNDDGALNATSPYPLLPDPRYSGVNQAHVEYGSIEDTKVKLGRQLLRVDNQRWVSDNDFRQIPQLFDGITVAHTAIANTELMAGYFRRVRTTSGVTNDLKLTLLHGAWNPLPGHAIAAYGYFHDQPQNGAFTGFANNSYRVAGARAEGAMARFGAIDVAYIAEIAQQRPYAGGDSRIDVNYWRLGAGLASKAWTLRYDYEVKGSNGGAYGLQMPLTDFYAFNGWTLHFFYTPRQGLHDQWITGRYAIGPVTLYAEAHRFRSDYGSLDFGRESDVGVTYELYPNTVLRLQHARYDAGSGAVAPDIRKTWLTLSYTY